MPPFFNKKLYNTAILLFLFRSVNLFLKQQKCPLQSFTLSFKLAICLFEVLV